MLLVSTKCLAGRHYAFASGQRDLDYVQKIVQSVRLARQRMVPARMGYSTGVSYINVNRQIIDRPRHSSTPALSGLSSLRPQRRTAIGIGLRLGFLQVLRNS